jgi:hypothetical protein
VSTEDVDRYYKQILEPDELRKRGQTAQALAMALELTALVPSVIQQTTSLHSQFDLGSIPPIETGCVLAAILGDVGALDKIEMVVTAHQELAPWCAVVEGGRRDLALVAAIRDYLAANPGAIQSELGRRLGCDGRQVSRLVNYMSHAGQVRREMLGRSYALYLAGGS